MKKIKKIQRHNGGGMIFSYDYSTLEVRIFSAISCDENLRDVLLSGADLHCNTARNIFPELKGMSDKEIKEHHSGLRSKAKSCFVAGTKVLMSDGSSKNIEDVKVEDVVVSREEFTNKIILSKVIRSEETNKVNELIKIQLNNLSTLMCTLDHKIRLKGGKYKEARYITTQDEIDSEFRIISVSHIHLTNAVPVYDIEVENESNSHNFCANGVFVHNCMFGLLYGKSAFNFAKDWEVSVEEAQKVIDGMMGAYQGIKSYVENQHKFAREHGYIIDVFGCTRPLPDAQLPDTKANRKRLAHAMNASQNCFVGDTKIDLLDGTTMTFKEVVDAYKKKDLYVYSVEKNGHIIPGEIIAAAQTKIVNELAQVTLDNGEVIKCTVDHKFIMRDGERKEARLLKSGDSVMSLYKHLNAKGYIVYKDNVDNKQKQVYDMVYTYYKGDKLPNNDIHHINKVKTDNTPNNLLQVTLSEHCHIQDKEDVQIDSVPFVSDSHKVMSVDIIECEPTPVYNIEIENREGTHNYALSSGVFVSNSPIQSSASRMAWIAGTHIAEEMLMHDLKTVMIGGVHDSTYIDVYPGELVPVLKICQFHAATVPNVIYDWMNGNKMIVDFGLGQSWGREMDVKKWELKDNKLILDLKGGNVNWDYLKRELDDGYEYEVLEMKDGDPIPPEEREDLPIEVPTQFVSVKLAFPDYWPNLEFKSKYYVGNGYYGKREEDR